MKLKSLSAKGLVVSYKPKQLGFRTTDDLEDLDSVLGQDRALDAIAFGTEIRSPGFNLYLLGEEGTGRNEFVRAFLKDRAAKMGNPDDWVYVHNFEVAHKPRALRLPPGRGKELALAMQGFIEEVHQSVPAFLESDEAQNQLRAMQEDFQQKSETEFDALREQAAAHHIALIRTPVGFGFAPMVDDEVIKPEEYEKLPKAEKQRFEAEIEKLEGALQETITRMPQRAKEQRDAIRDFLFEMTAIPIGTSLEQVIGQFKDLPEVLEHLEAVRQDLIKNYHGIQMAERKATTTEVVEEGKPSGTGKCVRERASNSEDCRRFRKGPP